MGDPGDQRVLIVVLIGVEVIVVRLENRFVIATCVALINPVSGSCKAIAGGLHEKVHASTDVCVRCGCNKVEMIIHENKGMNLKIVEVMREIECL